MKKLIDRIERLKVFELSWEQAEDIRQATRDLVYLLMQIVAYPTQEKIDSIYKYVEKCFSMAQELNNEVAELKYQLKKLEKEGK